MPSLVKVGGTFRSTSPRVKVSGAWQFASSAFVKTVSGWKNWFVRSGTLDPEFQNRTGAFRWPSVGLGTRIGYALETTTAGITWVGGSFTSTTVAGVSSRTDRYIVRLDSAGDRLAALTGDDSVVEIQVLRNYQDTLMLVGGDFTELQNVNQNRFIALNFTGTVNSAFNTAIGTSANGVVTAIEVQSDGKILLGGGDVTTATTTAGFTAFNGTAANRLIRLNSGGSIDTAFVSNIGTAANGQVRAIAIQSDGKIVIGGLFTSFNGTTLNRIARLNDDGTLDTTFNTNLGTGADGAINTIKIQSDGKILVGGDNANFNGTAVGVSGSIFRLNSNGTLDTSFNTAGGTGVNDDVDAIDIQSDGKIIVGGNFTTFNGATASRVLRLNADGSRDTSFTAAVSANVFAVKVRTDGRVLVSGNSITTVPSNTAINGLVLFDSSGNALAGVTETPSFCLAEQTDKKILVGGAFTTRGITVANRLVRLNLDGSIDTSFLSNLGTGANNDVDVISLQSDGKIVIGGDFTTFNGTTLNRLARLNSNGTLDTAFNTSLGTAANATIFAAAIQPDGKIVIGGNFTDFNGTLINRIARLNSNGTLDTTFNSNLQTGANGIVYAIKIQSDGKILVGGAFTTLVDATTVNRIARLNSNGTLDLTFTENMRSTRVSTTWGANGDVRDIALGSDGYTTIVGNFTTVAGSTRTRVARLLPTGFLDTSFSPGTGPNTTVYGVVLQNDGKAVITGTFTTVSGTTVNRIARLNSNGGRDTTFASGTGFSISGTTLTAETWQAVLLQDGKVAVSGAFTGFNGQDAIQIVKLGTD
jgi:uncharacterized delta-60 repeat protein